MDPKALMLETINMFKAEFASNDIQASSEYDHSYEELEIENVLCDPSRLRQILINLLTNVNIDTLTVYCKFKLTM